MRKLVLGVILTLFVLVAVFLITGINRKSNEKREIAEKISTLPAFSFTSLTNVSFNSSEIKTGPVLIVHFHPECSHCQYEISEILKSSIPAKCTNVIMISSAEKDTIKKFMDQFSYKDMPAVIPLADTSYLFGDIFGSSKVPSNYIYNRELNLVKAIYGEVKTETILKYIEEGE